MLFPLWETLFPCFLQGWLLLTLGDQLTRACSQSGLSQLSAGGLSPAGLLLPTLLVCCRHNSWLYIYSFAYLVLRLFLDRT